MSYNKVARTDSLLVTLRPKDASFLIVGGNRLASARAYTALEGGYRVFATGEVFDPELKYRISHGEIIHVEGDVLELIDKIAPDIVCVTDSLGTGPRRCQDSCDAIAALCASRRILVNVVDYTAVNTVSFPSTHRWRTGDTAHSLQVAVNTYGRGCRLATRIKREIVSSLVPEVGRAVDNIALIRNKIADMPDEEYFEPINAPVSQYADDEDEATQKARRMKWVAQVSEYWPIKTIGRLKEEDIDRILLDTSKPPPNLATPVISRASSSSNLELHSLSLTQSSPRILLLGSGPGHPALLTRAAYKALKSADLILADKLVPSEILALVPNKHLVIAKKFPGNAENAQIELQQLALDFLLARKAEGRGGTVVRLKQGDPYVYGRGGEEVLFFRQHGFLPIVVPGITSSLAAPLMFDIPVTQRGVADSMLLCTGVGRAGKTSTMPGYRKERTLIVLMGVARIGELIRALISDDDVVGTTRDGEKYPPDLPIAIIERGSSKDQRMITSTLSQIEHDLERVEQRPPGMIVIGWAIKALEESGDYYANGPRIVEGLRSDWQEFLDSV